MVHVTDKTFYIFDTQNRIQVVTDKKKSLKNI